MYLFCTIRLINRIRRKNGARVNILSKHASQLSITDLVAIILRFQLCSAHYTVLQMKNSRRSASAINPVTMEIMDNSCLQSREVIMLPRIDPLGCQQKEMGLKKDKAVCTAVCRKAPVGLR